MRLEHVDEVAVLHMDAGKANAVNQDFLAAIYARLDELVETDARALVLTGYDRFFSAGLDLVGLLPLDRHAMYEMIEDFHATMVRVFALPLPVVAAVNGHAIAGGCVLAMQADYRVLARGRVRFGLREPVLGVGLPHCVVESLRVQVPTEHLLEVSAEGRLYAPEEALERGLVQELADPDDVLPRAIEKARELGAIPAVAYAHVKSQLRGPALERFERDHATVTRSWLDTWFDPGTRVLLQSAVDQLGGKPPAGAGS